MITKKIDPIYCLHCRKILSEHSTDGHCIRQGKKLEHTFSPINKKDYVPTTLQQITTCSLILEECGFYSKREVLETIERLKK